MSMESELNNKGCGVRGYSILSRESGAYTHSWSVDRIYNIVYGEILAQIGKSIMLLKSGSMIRVPADVVRAFVSMREHALIKYYMPSSSGVCRRMSGAQRTTELGYAIHCKL